MNTKLNDKQKEALAATAATGAQHASAAANKATGWKKWILIALAIIATVAAALLQNSCQQVTPEQVQQAVDVAGIGHHAYHAITGEPCVFERAEVYVITEDCGK